ncbi:dual specificity protein phosphatase family protein [Streptomyces sp. TRM64462]|uniref:dual specificity protein phosphatase family protein n=1 Tax=Streptomyces sp. TRM64462 TaxID=2741726 RepID=UPI0015868243|nr:dual specificity protein phosphatase family protein [Streptomyces sp. TRM64462]
MPRVRQSDPGVPPPESPWNEIVPGLWMGGHIWADPYGELRRVVVEDEFSLVVSLYTAPGHGPGAGVEHAVREIPDGPLTAPELGHAGRAAALVTDAVQAGRTTLVRCFAGYNRSGLVTAQAVRALADLTAADAVALVRLRRSPWALHNRTFVRYLEAGLDALVQQTTSAPSAVADTPTL